MLMKCNYEAMEVWEVIEPGGDGVRRSQDRLAMGCLLRSVPKEMWQMLGSKRTVKEAWSAVKSMRVGAERVKEANAQRLLKEFENIAFSDGESVDDFAMRINALAADLRTSGEEIEDTRVAIPTLQDGDRLLVVNSLLCGDYQVGDIVIARKETFDSKPIVCLLYTSRCV